MFGPTLDGTSAVTVDTAGTTMFVGAVGQAARLTSLATDAAGTTAVNGGMVMTTGNQTFGDKATVGAPTTLFDSSASGTVMFGQTLDGASAVTANTAGATVFMGAVGQTARLASLATDAVGTTAVNGGMVMPTGSQTFRDKP